MELEEELPIYTLQLVKGEFDLYPEYTGTSWEAVLKKENGYDESKFDELQKEYKRKI